MGALNLDLLRQVMQLMADHKIDEVACEEFTVKMSRHAPTKVMVLDDATVSALHQEALEKHQEAPEAEPWQSISDAELAAWSVNKGAV